MLRKGLRLLHLPTPVGEDYLPPPGNLVVAGEGDLIPPALRNLQIPAIVYIVVGSQHMVAVAQRVYWAQSISQKLLEALSP